MTLLPGLRSMLGPRVSSHQGGWDEVLLYFGVPMALFVFLRYLGLRRERREAAEAGETDDLPGGP